MARITLKLLEDAFKAEARINGRLAARVDQLVERIDGITASNHSNTDSIVELLETRLNKAAQFVKAQEARIVALEEQNEKTRKQLWYLQKIAKGEFQPQAPKQADQPAQAVHEDVPDQAF